MSTTLTERIDFCRSRGYSFFLIPSGTKEPKVPWKKYQNILPTDGEVAQWKAYTYEMNICIVTGILSGIMVVDLDKPKDSADWDDSWAYEIIEKYALPKTFMVRTGSGGFHLYYKYPPWITVKNAVKEIPHLDIRGEGGVVVAPGSIHPNGRMYSILDDNAWVLADCPISIFQQKKERTKKEKRGESASSVTLEWSRNDTTFDWLRDQIKFYEDDELDELREKLSEYNQKRNVPSLEESELDTIYNSVTEYAEDNGKKNKINQAKKAIEILENSGKLVFDQNGDTYFVCKHQSSQKVMPLQGSEFRSWVQWSYYKVYEGVITSGALSGVIDILTLKANESWEKQIVDIRILKNWEAILYDLNDADKSCVRIDASWWSLIQENPWYFKRIKNTCEQVVPLAWWNIQNIWKYINIKDENTRLLVLCTIVSIFVPEIQHPILMVHGEKWSAKSTFLRILKQIVDPSTKELIGLPWDAAGLIHTFLNDYILMYDNISGISSDTSDILCRAVSGGSVSKRKLLTDSEDIIYRFKKCMCFNGINLEANQPDLLQRSVIIELEPINPDTRMVESTLWRNFTNELPHLLGCIFDILSKAMVVYATMNEDDYAFQRLADYNKWWEAICQSLGYPKGEFSDILTNNMGKHDEVAVNSNVCASTLMEFMRDRGEWTGIASTLREELFSIASRNGVWKYMPSTPQWLMNSLNKYRENLKNMGITFDSKASWSRNVTIHNSNTIPKFFDPFG